MCQHGVNTLHVFIRMPQYSHESLVLLFHFTSEEVAGGEVIGKSHEVG